MPLFQTFCMSHTLGMQVSLNVILPYPRPVPDAPPFTFEKKKYPTLYLLHGLSDDHSTWLRRTAIERYVEPLELAVVMPAVHRSFYTDMQCGHSYWTFVSEELPALCRSFFPLSEERSENFVAGLSMGGYGAFKLALRQPQRFAAAASLSGALDVRDFVKADDPAWSNEMQRIFGSSDDLNGSNNDLMAVAERLARSDAPKPRLYQACGTEDFLYENNLRFRDHAQALGFDLAYTEESANHEWAYWDREIRKVIQWLGFAIQ